MSLFPPERTPRERLGLFFLIWTGCFILFSILSQGFLMVYLGKEAYKTFIEGNTFTIAHVHIIRYLQVIMSIGIFGIPPVLFILLNRTPDTPPDWTFPRWNRVPQFKLLFLTIFIVCFSLPVVEWALEVNQAFKFPSGFEQLESYLHESEDRNNEFLNTLLGMDSTYDFIINFMMIAVITPIVEELLFRGTLQQLLQNLINPHVAIIITGTFFSMIHGEFYGFFPRMLLGILLGYLFFWSRSLWVPIFAHFLHNGLQVVLLFLFQRKVIEVDIEQKSFPPYLIIAGTILLFITLYIFDRAAQAQNPPDGERLGESLRDE